jgi:hypothetical protein
MIGFNPSLLGTIAACYGPLMIHFNGTVIKVERVYGLRSYIAFKFNSCTRAVNWHAEKKEKK